MSASQPHAAIPVICDSCRKTGLAGDSDFTHLGDLLEFTPVPRRVQRADGWTAERQRAFIAALSATGSKRQAAQAVGMAAYGVDQMLKSEGNDSFKAAFDRAIAIAQANGSMKIAQGVADAAARNAQMTPPSRLRGAPLPGQRLNEKFEYEDEDSFARRYEDSMANIARKILRARALYLAEISDSPGKRAAFEILTQYPIDWDKAARGEPQADEPYKEPPAMREPHMLLTAEAGWLHDWGGYGVDKKAELRRAIDQHRAEMGLEPIDWSESTED